MARKKKSAVYRVKQNAKVVVDHVMVSVALFIAVVAIAGAFILYQWKNVAINTCLKQIEQSESRIQLLNAEISLLEKRKNDLLQSVPQKAATLGLMVPDEKVEQLMVKSEKMVYYESKD